MFKKVAALAVLGASLAFAPAALAEHGGSHGGSEWKEKMKDMTPEQREAFKAERKAKWEALSEAEKLKMIEERRAKMKAEMDAKWASMSDAEKIKFAEERMKHKHKHGKHKGGEGRPAKPAE